MSRLLFIPHGKTIRICAELSRLPARIELPRRRAAAVWLLVFASSWSFGVPMLIFYAMTEDITAREGLSKLVPFLIAFAITMTVLYLAWAALRHYASNDRITFYHDKVEVLEHHLFTKRAWSAPYSTFSGLGLREQNAPVRDGKRHHYYIIELIHPDGEKTIPLFAGAAPHENQVINRMQDYSHRLGIPIL